MASSFPWAITGGPASGKSTLLQIIASYGISIVSADEHAAKVLELPAIAEQVASSLGMALPLDRSDLREKVVTDSAARRNLNAILHPHVLRSMEETAADVWEVPLLIETCLQHRFSRVVLAWCDEETQRNRLAARLGSHAEVDRWMRLQLPLDSKIVHSDWIVRTNMPMPNVRDDIATMIEAWR